MMAVMVSILIGKLEKIPLIFYPWVRRIVILYGFTLKEDLLQIQPMLLL